MLLGSSECCGKTTAAGTRGMQRTFGEQSKDFSIPRVFLCIFRIKSTLQYVQCPFTVTEEIYKCTEKREKSRIQTTQ